MDPLNPPVTQAEVGAALEVLFPDTFQRIVVVLTGAKRIALIPIDEEDTDEDG